VLDVKGFWNGRWGELFDRLDDCGADVHLVQGARTGSVSEWHMALATGVSPAPEIGARCIVPLEHGGYGCGCGMWGMSGKLAFLLSGLWHAGDCVEFQDKRRPRRCGHTRGKEGSRCRNGSVYSGG